MATHAETVARWMEECGRTEASYVSGHGMYVDDEGQLRFTSQGYAWDPESSTYVHRHGDNHGVAEGLEVPILARFVGQRHKGGFVLLNGDGFNSVPVTRWQTTLRQQVRRAFPNRNMLVPFAALRAAGVKLETIRPLDVTEDEQVMENHFMLDERPRLEWFGSRATPPTWTYPEPLPRGQRNRPPVPPDAPQNLTNIEVVAGIPARRHGQNPTARWAEARHGGHRLLLVQRHVYERERNIETSNFDHADLRNDFFVWGVDDTGRQGWRPLAEMYDEQSARHRWGWVENVHRLGACLFSAEGPDDRRHKYISAFDQNERQPLYFLAQLPDRSGAKTYREGVDALAPAIVHQARADGRLVIRQGDVFAVQTIATDEEVYGRAQTRVRREVVMQEEFGPGGRGRRTNLQAPAEEEVSEAIPCPHCEAPRRSYRMGHGPRARRALSIFGTGHTADEVVVAQGGVTFIRGTMYHDPQLEDPERRDPDHQPVPLGNGTEWFLAVRNTVPRQRIRRRRRTDEGEQAQAEEQPQTDVRDVAAVH